MRRRFERLPIHRKLVVLALIVSAVSLVVALAGLSVFDLVRYRTAAREDATALARVTAENVAAAVAFEDEPAAHATLGSLRVRDEVVRACVYKTDETLFTGFSPRPGSECPPRISTVSSWSTVAGTVPIVWTGKALGVVHVERGTSDLSRRLIVTSLVGFVMLLVAALAAYLLAQRVHGAISQPISELAVAARAFGENHDVALAPIAASPDEVGELVASFGGMMSRVRAASAESSQANEALRNENQERRRVEAALEAALVRERETGRLKDEFLAAVSHELRTPLNAIVGWSHILQHTGPDTETIRRGLATISKNADAQTRVIDDLIDVSRIITGKMKLALVHVDLRQVINASLESIQPMASAKGISVDAQLPSDACMVAGDVDRLQQVLWNLLSNAVKFTPRGGRVAVGLARHRLNFIVTVTDSGMGIAPAFVPHVFERFRQADGSMTRQHGGLGLGLAIVQELTELHGGTVTAASEGLDLGATFTVTIPESVSAGASVPAAGAVSRWLFGIRVLAVDDNPDSMDIMAAVLTRAGAEVQTANSADDAIRLWEHRPADVLVCDLAMPGKSGFDVLATIREMDARRGRVTRAIAVSAHASASSQAQSRAAGFLQHISKPIVTGDLVHSIAHALEQV